MLARNYDFVKFLLQRIFIMLFLLLFSVWVNTKNILPWKNQGRIFFKISFCCVVATKIYLVNLKLCVVPLVSVTFTITAAFTMGRIAW